LFRNADSGFINGKFYILVRGKSLKMNRICFRWCTKGFSFGTLFCHCVTSSCSLQLLNICLYRTGQIHEIW